ncbi:MAG: hypothetical protein WC889_13475 [Myxococcota bacterium]|jgi:hypothetical protein
MPVLDAFIIDKIEKDERRREERRPMLRLPVYIEEDDSGKTDKREDKIDDRNNEHEQIVINFS